MNLIYELILCPLWLLLFVSFAFKNFLTLKTCFQKHQLQSVSIVFLFAVLFIPSCNVLSGYFYVSLILVGISTVWILINFVRQLLKLQYFQEIFKSISFAKEHALCGRYEHSDYLGESTSLVAAVGFIQLYNFMYNRSDDIFFFFGLQWHCVNLHLTFFPVVKAKNTSGVIIDDISCRGPFSKF